MDDLMATPLPKGRAHSAARYARLDAGKPASREERTYDAPAADIRAVGLSDVFLDLDFGRLFGYLGRRKLWIAAAIVAGAIVGFGFGVVSPAKFTANTEVLIDPANLQVTTDNLYPNSEQQDAQVANVEGKMRVLTSGNVFQKVVDQLNLIADPEFVPPHSGLFGLTASTVSPAAQALQSMDDRVKAKRDEKSFVVTLSVTTNNAEKSAKIASAIVDAFRADLAQSASEGASRAADALSQRLDNLKDDVTKADTAVEDYRRAHDLQSTSQGELTSTTTMTQVNAQLLDAQSKLILAQARYDKLTTGSADGKLSAAAQESTTLSALRTQYAAVKQQADSLRATLGPKHPSVRAILPQVTTLQGQIAAETARILQSAKSDAEQAQATVDQLQAAAETSKTVVAQDNSAQVTLRELEREASSRSAIYEAFLGRARQIAESEQIDTTNIRVISEAIAPTSRSWPPPSAQLALLGGAAGFALGALAALAFGVFDERKKKPTVRKRAVAA